MSIARDGLISFDAERFPFNILVADAVRDRLGMSDIDLGCLHNHVGHNDLGPVFASIYDLFLTDRFTDVYDDFCSWLVGEMFAGNGAYQKVPSARIQLPGHISVNYHTDEWYGHGHDVQNFWLPVTTVSGSNSMYVCDEAGSLAITDTIRRDRKSISDMNKIAAQACNPLSMNFGQVFYFNSHIIHGTEVNRTDKSRVSFDFRVLRDGDDRGIKDESFFLRPGSRRKSGPAQKRVGAMYIGKRDGFTQLISQKYQILLCTRYAEENNIAAHLGETELSGFDHLPTLWNMIDGGHAGTFTDLIAFSAMLLPGGDELSRIARACEAKHLTAHFVAEDMVAASVADFMAARNKAITTSAFS